MQTGRGDERGDAEVTAEVVLERGPVRHVRARAVATRDQAFLLKHGYRRAHGGARDRTIGGQLGFGGQLVAGSQLTRADPVTDLVGELMAQRLGRAHGATTSFSAAPARMRANASGVASSGMTSETTDLIPPASA